MNKDKHMKKAQEFISEGSAYVHCEIKNGETKLGVGGDIAAIIYACYRTLKRTEEISGAPFANMLETLEDYYNIEEAKKNARDS